MSGATKRIIFILVSCLIINKTSYSQRYDFQNYTVENGLSQSVILSIYQSSDGELWLGTNQGGINKYNGTNFTYITKSDGLSDNIVYCITELSNGKILTGTNNGLTILNGNKKSVLTTKNGLSHNGVVSMHESKDNLVWLGTGKGLCILEGDSIHSFFIDSLLSGSTIMNIREDEKGGLWFCTTTNGLFFWNGREVKHFTVSNGMRKNYVFDVMPIAEQDRWMFKGAGENSALVFGYSGLYVLRGDSLADFKNPLKNDETIFYCFERDKAANLWIGTNHGVIKYDGFRFDLFNEKNGLVDNNIWKILHDREGNMWFASKSNGLSKLNSERFKLYNSSELPDIKITSIFRDSKSRKWVGTGKGIAIWERDTVIKFGIQDGLSSEAVRDIDEDENGILYFATNYGITTYNGKEFKAYYAEQKGLNNCYDIFADGNTVWIGTSAGVAIFKNGIITQPFNAPAFPDYVFDAFKKGNKIWFAYEDGLLTFDGSLFTKLDSSNGFYNGRTRSIASGVDDALWFGTNNGVYRWKNNKLWNIKATDGLIADAVYALEFQNSRTLWVGQSFGVSKITLKDDTISDIIHYTKDQGFMGLECSPNAIWKENPEKLWIGTSRGICIYESKLDKAKNYAPLTKIIEVKLFSQPVDWPALTDSVSQRGIPFNPEINYANNHITIVFSGVSFSSPASINYVYKLEGFDQDWSPVTNKNEAVYSSLPPGDYIFKVKSGYGNEIWKNQEETFRFTILPPFYKTTWFYLLCLLIASFIAYSYFRIRKANIKITSQNIKIEAQKKEIEKRNVEVMDSIRYASNIQSAILPSADQLKHSLLDSFVLFLPKDIISGDFYWMSRHGDDVYFAVVDCTGHGVPGAMMSMFGYNALNQAIKEKEMKKPSEILNYLNGVVNESLKNDENNIQVRDGMDIALCRFNPVTRRLEYAGANIPLLLIQNGEPKITKATKVPIGSDESDLSYKNHEFNLNKGDCIYIYSDGFADQFGGAFNKKLTSRRMRTKMKEIQALNMQQQGGVLKDLFISWKGNEEQVDDVCIVGMKVNPD